MFFWTLAEWCTLVAERFWWLGGECKDKPFINVMSDLFYSIGDKFREMHHDFRDAHLWADNVGRGLMDRLMTSELSNAISTLFTSWETLRTDPDFWIRDIIRMACGFGPYEVQNWDFVAKSILAKYIPTLYHFWKYTLPDFGAFFSDPQDAIRYWIGNTIGIDPYNLQTWEFMIKAIFDKYFPALYRFWWDDLDSVVTFIRDPANSIRFWIGNQIGLSPYNMQDWEFMIKGVFEMYFPTLYDFWRFGVEDPVGWFLEKLEAEVQRWFERLGNVTLEIVALLLGV